MKASVRLVNIIRVHQSREGWVYDVQLEHDSHEDLLALITQIENIHNAEVEKNGRAKIDFRGYNLWDVLQGNPMTGKLEVHRNAFVQIWAHEDVSMVGIHDVIMNIIG